ncbi:MAG: aminodeoxychorismate/anthranilate synthase component II [Planctomycetes bacterium]|nr:aminodeoxychorismate/anthranilate synthase component II [Planctomycetota bacterium]
MVLIIDNYDSFTYNLVQLIGALGFVPKVVRNDRSSGDRIAAQRPSHLIVSPGPCTPSEAGISVEVIRSFAGKIPILGVCLGHQCIGVAFGGRVTRAARLMHGKTSVISHDGQGCFSGLPDPFTAARYHSLVVEEAALPPSLEVTARSEFGELMGLRHRDFPVEGVQFHPESFLTEGGAKLIGNFLKVKAA